MIYDNITNSSIYKGINENLDKALDFLQSTDFSSFEPGKHDVDGDRIFINIISTQTKSVNDAFFEYHKSYLDVHFVIEGEEKILVSNVDSMINKTEFNHKDDYALQEGETQAELILVKGKFCVVFPDDSHLPLIANKEQRQVKKGVIKVLI